MFCILFEHLGTNQMNYFTFYTGKDNEKNNLSVHFLWLYKHGKQYLGNMIYKIYNLKSSYPYLSTDYILEYSNYLKHNSTFLLWLIKKPNLTAGFRKQRCRTSRLLLWRNILSTLFLTSLFSHFRIFSVVCLFGFKSLDSEQLQAAAKAMHGVWC